MQEATATTIETMPARARSGRLAEGLVFALSIAAALALWEVVSRAGLISQTDLPAMSATFGKLWDLMQTGHFWGAFLQTVRGWALGLLLATVLAVPFGIVLGSSDFANRAFRVPIEFLRPIPSAALIPLLFLTLGTTLQSEIFLATFGAFWPLLIQTIYGVRDVDPLALDTGRSFGLGIATGLAVPLGVVLGSSEIAARALRVPIEFLRPIPSAVLIPLLFLTLGTTLKSEVFLAAFGAFWPLLIQTMYGVRDVDPLAIAVGFLGVAIHLAFAALERRALRWHPSQRADGA